MTVVVVSWILVLLAAFGMNYSRDVLGESRSVRLEVQRHQLRAWARSGVELARVALVNTPSIDCAALGHTGPDNMFAFPLSCGQGNFAVGEATTIYGENHWLPGIGDEAGKLPVALADSIALSILPGMTPHGIAVRLEPRKTAGSRPLPPFELLADLDESSRESARRYVSRYGNAVNVNTASEEVLLAVGLPRRVVFKFLEWRSGSDRILGNADDQYFQGLGSDDAGIRASFLNSEEAAVLAFLSGEGRLKVDSRFFHLVSRGWGAGYRGICEIRVILERTDYGAPSVLEWSENWLN